MAAATPAARLASGTGAWRNSSSLPIWGSNTHALPTMSEFLGCQSSGTGLLSPLMVQPARSDPPTIRWMTMIPSPG